MSHDLFAAFSEPPSQPTNHEVQPPASVLAKEALFDGWASPQNEPQMQRNEVMEDADDDDFGDFEDASAPQPQEQEAVPAVSSTPPKQAKQTSFPPKADPWKQTTVSSTQKKTGSHPFAGNMDLLFAADDDEYDAGQDDYGDISTNPEAAMAYSKKLIEEQQRQQELSKHRPGTDAKSAPAPVASKQKLPEKRVPNKLRKKSGFIPARDPDVLFDAEDPIEQQDDDDDDDDFGDFETFEQTTSQPAAPSTATTQMRNVTADVDLLGLDDEPTSTPATAGNGTARTVPSQSNKSASTFNSKPSQPVEEEAWDDFEAAAPAAPSSAPASTNTTRASSTTSRSNTTPKPTSQPQTSTGGLPPTNIPPPVVLLSIFPRAFASAEETLFSPLSKLPTEQRQLLLSHSATHAFLVTYLQLAHVLAHVIAGRKQRWKRDQILAQSMRIGPAAAGAGGRGGGMKLAGVDKAEAAKEDREVLDVVRQWKAQVGKLRTAVTGAKSAGARKLPSVPEIAEAMPIRTLRVGEGGIVASHACALCGLKREERVAKADVDVEDSFGEWWVEGTNMHVTCLRFWEERKGSLKSR